MEKAVFGAGCFWHVELAFSRVPGVIKTTAGYTGGAFEDPSYEDVCTGETGHAEAVLVEFDPERVSYEELLNLFWSMHDPTTPDRQGPDMGTQYRSVIFYHTPQQETLARDAKRSIEESGVYPGPIVTEIVPARRFYPAEEYHQRYLEKKGRDRC